MPLTVNGGLKVLGQHGLGLADALCRAGPRVEAAVQTHLLQHVDVVVQLKGTVEVEHVLRPVVCACVWMCSHAARIGA